MEPKQFPFASWKVAFPEWSRRGAGCWKAGLSSKGGQLSSSGPRVKSLGSQKPCLPPWVPSPQLSPAHATPCFSSAQSWLELQRQLLESCKPSEARTKRQVKLLLGPLLEPRLPIIPHYCRVLGKRAASGRRESCCQALLGKAEKRVRGGKDTRVQTRLDVARGP